MSSGEEILLGGYTHGDAVVRVGDTVRRPPSPYRASIDALLEHLDERETVEVPKHLGRDDRGRDVFSYIEGEVPIPPYPKWAVTDEALASIGMLLRRYHDAVASFRPPAGAAWAPDLADPRGGDLVCHNDVCLENVVFRDGEAVGLLDFDLAAPGPPAYDLAMAARLCGPARHPLNFPAEFAGVDPIHKLVVICRAYGLRRGDEEKVVAALSRACEVGQAFVRARAASGMPYFVELLAGVGERYRRDDQWVRDNASAMIDALRSTVR